MRRARGQVRGRRAVQRHELLPEPWTAARTSSPTRLRRVVWNKNRKQGNKHLY